MSRDPRCGNCGRGQSEHLPSTGGAWLLVCPASAFKAETVGSVPVVASEASGIVGQERSEEQEIVQPSSSSPISVAQAIYYVWLDRPLQPPVRATKPRRRHATLDSAMTEARRLAVLENYKAIVLKVEAEVMP